jgi:ankyrin repeat protein
MRSRTMFFVTVASLSLVVSTNALGQPLHYAAEKGNLAEVKQLIEQGADVNAKGRLGHTPLHMACMEGHLEVVEFLIAKGADVNAKSAQSSSSGETPLHFAAEWGHLEITQLLVAKGANVNAKSDRGVTPLHSAGELGLGLDVAEFLISKGANVNAKTDRGVTPLHSAAHGGNASLVEFLITQGADVNAVTRDGRTPLNMAFDSGHKEVADLLRQYGAHRARQCMTAKDIETINKGILEKRTFHITGKDAKIFLAVDPRLLVLEGHFALLMEQDIDEIMIWKFKRPPGAGAAVPFVKGCVAEGYGEPDMFDKLRLMQDVVVAIDKYGVDHTVVRDKIRRLLPRPATATPEELEAQTDKIISRVRAIVEGK